MEVRVVSCELLFRVHEFFEIAPEFSQPHCFVVVGEFGAGRVVYTYFEETVEASLEDEYTRREQNITHAVLLLFFSLVLALQG